MDGVSSYQEKKNLDNLRNYPRHSFMYPLGIHLSILSVYHFLFSPRLHISFSCNQRSQKIVENSSREKLSVITEISFKLSKISMSNVSHKAKYLLESEPTFSHVNVFFFFAWTCRGHNFRLCAWYH